MQAIRVERQIGGRTLSIETGTYAKLADGSVTVQYGDTVVFGAVVRANPREGIDFFPLQVDYRERRAAAGKFPGGFMKREGRPTNKEILTARLIDRPLRPLFPKGFMDEVQIHLNVLAFDRRKRSGCFRRHRRQRGRRDQRYSIPHPDRPRARRPRRRQARS